MKASTLPESEGLPPSGVNVFETGITVFGFSRWP